MPLPLPADDDVLLEPPGAEETTAEVRAMAAAVESGGTLTPLQRAVLEAVTKSMTGHAVDLGELPPFDAAAAAAPFARRNLMFRSRLVQVMLLGALVLRPLPEDVVDRATAMAAELGVDEQLIPVARRFADGALGLAGIDFERNGYTAEWHPDDARFLHTSRQLQDAWESAVADAPLAARWRELEDLPGGSLGRRVTELYRARGFVYPGMPGSAPPLLAQHDWVHVLADYGTTVEAELEVFAFIARANDDLRAFSLLAMVVSLFETGYLRTGAGLFQADTGHLSAGSNVVVRMADAMRRGARCTGSVDFLGVDWFELAPLPVDEVRRRFGVEPKSPEAIAAGSVGPWERGGISPFQLRAGQDAARAAGAEYDAFGASVA
ncbi:MAG TPA: hypothetical protein VFA84_05280 [Acidimicrobiales bacterium]|nr:hypothetical protein [Acidimicrobiales bacterium]